MTRRPSQCDLIAAVLADGSWHTVAEIHQRCGFSRLNSRVADLRKSRSMQIECRHVPGKRSGSEAYEYRYVASERAAVEPARPPAALSGASHGSPAKTAGAPDLVQLDLWAAA